MGKNWRGGKGGGGGGGGYGGGNDFASCRGHGVIIGTCDAARERETSKELLNLLNQAIEELYPHLLAPPAKDGESEEATEGGKSSIEQLLKAELDDVRQKKHSGAQHVTSINTGVKGITLIKISRREICPLALVKSIFARVKREKEACCRHVVRIVPLKSVFFPNEEELRENMKYVVEHGLYEDGVISTLPSPLPVAKKTIVEESPAAESTESNEEPQSKRQKVEETTEVEQQTESPKEEPTNEESSKEEPTNEESPKEEPTKEEQKTEDGATVVAPVETYTGPKFPYMVHFKSRNHNVLTKDLTVSIASEFIKPYAYGDYKTPQVVILVEALKNLGGMTWLRNCDEYLDFNIRRYQAEHAKSDV